MSEASKDSAKPNQSTRRGETARPSDDLRYDAEYRQAEAEHRARLWEVVERDLAYERQQPSNEELDKYYAMKERAEAQEAKWAAEQQAKEQAQERAREGALQRISKAASQVGARIRLQRANDRGR